MTHVLLILLPFLFTFQAFFCRMYSAAYQGKKSDAASGVYSIIFGFFIGLITWGLNGFSFAPSVTTVICGLMNAAILYLYNTSLVRGSVTGSYGFLTVCSMSGNMLLPVFANAVINRIPVTVIQITALVLLLISFFLLNSNSASRKVRKGYSMWCVCIFLSNGVYGIILNLQQQLCAGAQRTEMVVITYLAMAAAVLILSLFKGKNDFTADFRMGRKALLFAMISCTFATCASNLLVYLITRAKSLPLLYAMINGGMLVASTLLAAFLLKEKLTPLRIAGIVLSCAGIVLLCL